MKRIFFLGLALLILCIFSSCEKEEPPLPPDPPELVLLKESLAAIMENYIEDPDIKKMFIAATGAMQEKLGEENVSFSETPAGIRLTVGKKQKQIAFDPAKGPESIFEVFKIIRDEAARCCPKVTGKTLLNAILTGMCQGLDSNSIYLDPTSDDEMEMATKGRFGGIGVEITLVDERLMVKSLIDYTPAYRAGIKAGDRIINIDDKDVSGLSLVDAANLLRGEVGSRVKLNVLQEGADAPVEFVMVRDIIKIESVKSEMRRHKQAYIRIYQFDETTFELFTKALDKLEFDKRMQGLILDLRGNPGGGIDVGANIIDAFIDEGPILSVMGRLPESLMVIYADKLEKERNYPMVVLIDRATAGIAEVVAASLQDYGRAVIIGETSFGKSTIQSIIILSDGSMLRITTAKINSAKDRAFISGGLTPDIDISSILAGQDKLLSRDLALEFVHDAMYCATKDNPDASNKDILKCAPGLIKDWPQR
jgi:carboxyl-terminal processing protease